MDGPKNTRSRSILLVSRMERHFVYGWFYVGNRKVGKVNAGNNNLGVVYNRKN
jgi:hypothetical protein